MKQKKRKDAVKPKGEALPTPSILDCYDSESAVSAEFHRLINSLNHREPPQDIKSIIISSAMPGEGKSIISAYMAIEIAKSSPEKQVLLMDFDLRRPIQHRFLNCATRTPGLSDLIQGKVELDGIIRDTEIENLKIITSGASISKTSHLIREKRENIASLIQECTARFDRVILDTPPIIPVSDTEIISPHVDAVLLVILAGKTYREIIQRAIDVLKKSDANLIGMVLNDVKRVLPYYYDYKYYHYRYETKEP